MALRILDRPNGDPDDDLAVLSRQLLRSDEQVAALGAKLDASESRHQAELAAAYLAAYALSKEHDRMLMEEWEKVKTRPPLDVQILALTPDSAKRALALREKLARLKGEIAGIKFGLNNAGNDCRSRIAELETQVRELGGTP